MGFKNQTIFYPLTTNPTPCYYPLLNSSNSALPIPFHSTYALPTQTIPSSSPTPYPSLLSYPPELHPPNPPYLHPTLLICILPSLTHPSPYPLHSPFIHSKHSKKPYPFSNPPSFLNSTQPPLYLFVSSQQTIHSQPQPYPKPNPIFNLLLS